MSYPATARPLNAMPRSNPFASAAQGSGSPYAAQAARYRDAELLSATPGQLVVMLYDKMLLTLRRARIACEAGLRAEAIPPEALQPGVEVAGVVTLLAAVGNGQIVTL